MPVLEEIFLDQKTLPYEYFETPFPVYQRLREEHPIYWSDNWDCWILTRYDDVYAVIRDFKRFSSVGRISKFLERLSESKNGNFGTIHDHFSTGLINTDPPDHTRQRKLVRKGFSPTLVESMRPHVEKIVGALLDDVQDRGQMDVIADFSYLLPTTVVTSLLRVRLSDRDQFNEWCDSIFLFQSKGIAETETAQKCEESLRDLRAYFRRLLDTRKRVPQDDLTSRLAAAEDEGEKLTEAEVMSSMGTLLIGGYETTMSLIGSAIVELLQHPDQMELLRNDPSLIESAVEEFLRYDSPAQRLLRVATEDVELDGVLIKKGQMVSAMLGAANHDPSQFPDPSRLDITREDNKHLAFGFGAHVCIGGQLARMESQIAIGTFLERLPGLRLDPSQPIRWRTSAGNRGPRSVPVLF